MILHVCLFFFSSRRRHTRYWRDWSSDVCSSDLDKRMLIAQPASRSWNENPWHLPHRGDPHHLPPDGGGGPATARRRRERIPPRSEERRVGEECRSRWSAYQ